MKEDYVIFRAGVVYSPNPGVRLMAAADWGEQVFGGAAFKISDSFDLDFHFRVNQNGIDPVALYVTYRI